MPVHVVEVFLMPVHVVEVFLMPVHVVEVFLMPVHVVEARTAIGYSDEYSIHQNTQNTQFIGILRIR